MACSRGKASPDRVTMLQLFAASGGFCQNPSCNRELFLDTGSKRIHIAEMAHVFAANDHGPRANAQLTTEERGAYDNLILLCSTCHTTIDKAPEDFPDTLLRTWKRNHEYHIERLFGAVHFQTRSEVKAAIEPLLRENGMIHQEFNPGLDYRYDPESEEAEQWRRRMVQQIIPNNRRILATLETNREHMTESELRTLELFRQHIIDLEARHLTHIIVGGQRQYPTEGMSQLMETL